jgi:hypothetical protein
VIATRQLADVQPIAALVPRKLAVVRIPLNPEMPMRHLAAVEPVWRNDLTALMADVPDFAQVRSVLRPWLDDLFNRMSGKEEETANG